MAKKRSYGVELLIKGKDLASPTINRVGRSLKLLTSPIRSLGRLAKGLGGLIEKVPGLAILGSWVGSLAGHFKELALSAATYADTLDNLRNHTGINAKAIQSVAFAADHAGVPFEQFSQGLRKMTEVLGRGVQASQLKMLGKGARGFVQALKGAKTPTEQFELILSQMAAIPDTAKRAAFGMAFFSEPGVKLAAIATNGADGIRQMRIEAERLGIVMSDEDISKADQFADSWANIGKLVDSTKRDFGAGLVDGLLPALQDLLTYAKANRKEIGAFVKELGRKVGGGIVDAAKAIRSAVTWIVENKSEVIGVMEKVGYGVAALAGLSVLGPILAGLAASPFFALIAAAVAGVAWLLANTPKEARSEAQVDDAFVQNVKSDGWAGGFGISFVESVAAAATNAMNPSDENRAAAYNRFGRLGRSVAQQDEMLSESVDRKRKRNFDDSAVFNSAAMSQVRAIRDPSGLGMSFGGPLQDQSVEVKVIIEDKGGNTDGDPKVKAPGAARVSAVTKGNTGKRSQVYADGGR